MLPRNADGKIDGVELAQQNALLALQSEARERIGAAVDALREIPVGVRSEVVDVCNLRRAAGGEIALDQVVGRVVVARNLHPRRTHSVIGVAERRHPALLLYLLRRAKASSAPVPYYGVFVNSIAPPGSR